MTYTVHQAKTNLSRLIKEAEEGKEVIILRGKTPVAKLVALSAAQQPTPTPRGPAPLTDEELSELGL
jgi:prevent-host-death family protein